MNQNITNTIGNILLADDEQTFLTATAQLLRNEGFYCDCAENSQEALKKLSKTDYDLLIADIKMPGNSNLELVRKVIAKHPAISIILVTGYPSQQTAIEAIGLAVAAYMLKPPDFGQLLQNAKLAVKISLLYKTIDKTKGNLLKWSDELENIELSLTQSKNNAFETALKSFLAVTTAKIDETFENIRFITNLLDDIKPDMQICEVMQCPKLSNLTEGIKQAVNSIKESKELYKSKQLEEIREKLEKLLENTEES